MTVQGGPTTDFDEALPYATERSKAARLGILVPPVPSDVYDHRVALASLRGKTAVPQADFDADSFSLANRQTSIKQQERRGTCYAFAGAAALEAFLKGRDSVELDLSEHYLFHMHKVTDLPLDAPPPAIETGNSLVGFQGNAGILDDMVRFALPLEADAPYILRDDLLSLRSSIPEAGPPAGAEGGDFTSQEALDAFEYSNRSIPLASRWSARYRVLDFNTVADLSHPALEQILRSGHEIVVDVPGHCMLLIGYDRQKRAWLFKNSWGGDQWRVAAYDDPIARIEGAAYIVNAAGPDAPPQMHAWWVGRWNMDHDGWRGTLMIRRYTNRRDQPGTDDYQLDGKPTKLGTYYGAGGPHDVHGYFKNGGRTMVFFIAPDGIRRPPGSLVGDPFEAHVLSFDPGNAGGVMTWSGTRYGLYLSRETLPKTETAPFTISSWLGSWALNLDGWRGQLKIHSVSTSGTVKASYTAQGGEETAVSAELDSSTSHLMRVQLRFTDPGQRLSLYHHTQESGVLSGILADPGGRYGLQGLKVMV